MLETLGELVKDGRLPVGTHLHHRGRQHQDRTVDAKVAAGGIELRGKVYRTPTEAARIVTGYKTDGWHFWHLPDGRRIDSLRQAPSFRAYGRKG